MFARGHFVCFSPAEGVDVLLVLERNWLLLTVSTLHVDMCENA